MGCIGTQSVTVSYHYVQPIWRLAFAICNVVKSYARLEFCREVMEGGPVCFGLDTVRTWNVPLVPVCSDASTRVVGSGGAPPEEQIQEFQLQLPGSASAPTFEECIDVCALLRQVCL